jgi:PAS domain S-box-containing protein
MKKKTANFSREMMSFLNTVSKELASSLDYEVTIQKLSQLVVPKMADWFTIEALTPEGKFEQISISHVNPEQVRWAKLWRKQNPVHQDDPNGVAKVISTKQSEIYPEITTEMMRTVSKNKKQQELIEQLGICSSMIVPLIARGYAFGAISFILSKESGRHYEAQDLLLAEEFAHRAALALDNAKLYRQAQEEIAERKAAEHRLEISQTAGHIGTYEIDLEKKTVYWSPELERLFGLKPGSFDGTQDAWFTFVHPDDKELLIQDRDRQLKESDEVEFEFRIIRADGEVRWIYSKGKYFRNKKGKLAKTVGINMDITERKRLERQKDEFLTIASHELKTPLTSIKAFVQILDRYVIRPEHPESRNYLSKMDHQIDKLTKLVQDLLDVSKIQTGKLDYNEDLFDLHEFIREIVEEMQPLTDQHQLIYAEEKEIFLRADKYRLGQVLTNFISNAIKYSPDGGKIVISTYTDKDSVTVSVQDFGIGIPADKKKFLFQRFYRVMDKKRESFPGLGLGLYISSEIMKRQKGKIWFESEEGKGSTFSFSLPLTRYTDENEKGNTKVREHV